MKNKDLVVPSLRSDIEKIQGISEIENIVNECMPIACAKQQNITEALILAKGVEKLREFFLENEAIKATIEAIQDTNLGFTTDRSPKAIKKSGLRPYTYAEVVDCSIEALFKGYRLTGKEFSIIAFNFYANKDGKQRHIMEIPGLTDFDPHNTPPVYSTEVKVAKNGDKYVSTYGYVVCSATWNMNGQPQKLENLELKIKVNAGMGDDAIVGKSLSKLYSRILLKTTGQIIPESTDIATNEVIEHEEVKQIEKPINPFTEVKPEKKEDPKPVASKKPLYNKILGNLKKNDINLKRFWKFMDIEDPEQLSEDACSVILARWDDTMFRWFKPDDETK